MGSPSRFVGGCELLAEIDVSDLIAWIDGISRASWPNWTKGPDRPVVLVDPRWESLTENTDRVVAELMTLFPGCRDTSRSITTIHPGDYVPPHTDTCSEEWITRIHVPIITNPDAWFVIDGLAHHLDVGMAYQVNPGRLHSVSNYGSASRIHLMFDVVN